MPAAMSKFRATLTIPSTDILLSFTDTGVPPTGDPAKYTTFVIVHGHSYHAGVFQRLAVAGSERNVRIICINRRGYPGSKEHTVDEETVYKTGPDEKRAALVNDAGVYLALCVDGIIQQCGLPPAGHLALVGWSLGNVFTLSAMASITTLPAGAKKRLQSFVKTLIMWDPPSQALGIPSPAEGYVPLYDTTLPDPLGAFVIWVASYFTHPDLAGHKLEYRLPDNRKPSFQDTSAEELNTIMQFAGRSAICDTCLTEPPFASVLNDMVNRALFDPEVRAAWKDTKMCHMYGEATSWNVIWSVWSLEERTQMAKGQAPITFQPIKDAHHFPMWDDPRKTLDVLIGLTED